MITTKKTWAAGLLSLALAGAAPVWAQDVTADTVVATVGGKEITIGHMIVARNALPPQYQQLDAATLWDGVLDQLVQQNALAQTLGDEVTTATRLSIENQTSGLLAGEALGKVVQEKITPEAIQATFDERYAGAEPEQEFHAAHILVESEDDAKALKTELEGGADFATLAQEKSTGPSGPNGGDLGWFGKGMMVPEFEAAVVALDAGAVSDPVKTQFGWHVIRLNETRDAPLPTLEDVREAIVAELEGSVVEELLDDLMAKTEVVKSEVEFDPAVLGNLDLIAN